MRIAAMASGWKLRIHPHTSATGLNMAATLHFLASIDNGGYFEADAAVENLFRDRLTSRAWTLGDDGCVRKGRRRLETARPRGPQGVAIRPSLHGPLGRNRDRPQAGRRGEAEPLGRLGTGMHVEPNHRRIVEPSHR